MNTAQNHTQNHNGHHGERYARRSSMPESIAERQGASRGAPQDARQDAQQGEQEEAGQEEHDGTPPRVRYREQFPERRAHGPTAEWTAAIYTPESTSLAPDPHTLAAPEKKPVQEPVQDVATLRGQIKFLRKRETLLSRKLFEARDQLQQARAEMAALRAGMAVSMPVNGAHQTTAAAPELQAPDPGAHRAIDYSHLVRRIRDIVISAIPVGAAVAVVSRGDESLLEMDKREGWHFPQTQNGVYAGFYPAESKTAIGHLESLRTRGAGYLLFPKTAFWWLDHYPEFKRHLNHRYHRIWEDDSCLIYQLEAQPEAL